MDNKSKNKSKATQDELTDEEIRFVDAYMISFDKTKAFIDSHPNCELNSVEISRKANGFMGRTNVRQEITNRIKDMHELCIMSAGEIMETFTRIARGQETDQFGLDPSLKDRMDALKELAKRQIDVPRQVDTNKQLEIHIIRE